MNFIRSEVNKIRFTVNKIRCIRELDLNSSHIKGYKMTTEETIKSWKWRIVKAGHTAKSFADLIGISPSLLSEYISGAKTPSIERYDLIENKLQELKV